MAVTNTFDGTADNTNNIKNNNSGSTTSTFSFDHLVLFSVVGLFVMFIMGVDGNKLFFLSMVINGLVVFDIFRSRA